MLHIFEWFIYYYGGSLAIILGRFVKAWKNLNYRKYWFTSYSNHSQVTKWKHLVARKDGSFPIEVGRYVQQKYSHHPLREYLIFESVKFDPCFMHLRVGARIRWQLVWWLRIESSHRQLDESIVLRAVFDYLEGGKWFRISFIRFQMSEQKN